MTRAPRRPLHWLPSITLLAAACLPPAQGVHASTPSAVEAELLSGARMWASKNRPDMARQLVDKVLAMDPYSPQGLGTLGDLALREKKMDEAKRILDTLRSRHPGHAVTQELETLVRVYGSEREKLSQMRLMARAGRKAEAADLARDDGWQDRLAGITALVAGIIWGSKLGVQFSLTTLALRALPVVILGGLTSVPGAIIGGLIIGVGEKLSEVYLGPYVGGGIEIWFAYVLALVFLLFRPQGLFGEKIIDRV